MRKMNQQEPSLTQRRRGTYADVAATDVAPVWRHDSASALRSLRSRTDVAAHEPTLQPGPTTGLGASAMQKFVRLIAKQTRLTKLRFA